MCRHVKRDKEIQKQDAVPVAHVDYSLKQGQKISLNIAGKLGLGSNEDSSGSTAMSRAAPAVGECPPTVVTPLVTNNSYRFVSQRWPTSSSTLFKEASDPPTLPASAMDRLLFCQVHVATPTDHLILSCLSPIVSQPLPLLPLIGSSFNFIELPFYNIIVIFVE